MEFKYFFSKAGVSPYEHVNWIRTTAEIAGSGFKQEDVEFPDFYSQNAINIIASKYFAGKIGSPEREYSLKQLIDRIVFTNTIWGLEGGYFGENEQKAFKSFENPAYNNYETPNAYIFAQELRYMLLHQMFSFNSPVWFNVGNPARNGKYQISACFILGAEDNMESIEENYVTESEIFRYGSGAGSNRSKLRSSKERISGGGYSSGPNSFMRVYDSIAKAVKSGGLTRRAAKMEILNADHGDIQEFIWQKKKEEDKAKVLIAAGYSDKFDDPNGAYGSVYFQNSNQSVRVTDAFMKAVEDDQDWALIEVKRAFTIDSPAVVKIFEVDKLNEKITHQGYFYTDFHGTYIRKSDGYYGVIKVIKARDLFNEIAQCAWETGDPGMQFHDIINFWHTCKASGIIEASNPCSEYMFLNDTSCNLASLRLTKFLDKDGKFMVAAFCYAVRVAITAMDIWIDNAHYPTEKIAVETKKYRTLGLGYTDLGALLLQKLLPYDSKEGREYAAAITALMHGVAYYTSWELGRELGAFSEFNNNVNYMHNVITEHRDHVQVPPIRNDHQYNDVENIWRHASVNINAVYRSRPEDFKIRNAQVTVLAPTGTISFMMDCETTGIEPVLALESYKTLVGGGAIKLTIPSAEIAGDKLGYKDLSHIPKEHKAIFATSLDKENTISWQAHIKMMAAVQPFLSGAISKTVNMPNSATVEDVKNAYMMAWAKGLKAIAIYRDGCKASQPLNIKKDDNKKIEEKHMDKNAKLLSNGRPKPVRKKLNDNAQAIRHKFEIGGQEGYLHVGLFDNGEPGEIFITMSKAGSTIRGLMDVIGMLVSIGLQHGIPLQAFIDKFKNSKFDPAGLTKNKLIRLASSPIDYIGRFLESEFVEEDENEVINDNNIEQSINVNNLKTFSNTIKMQNESSGDICSNCGTIMINSGKCKSCPGCGETTGCG